MIEVQKKYLYYVLPIVIWNGPCKGLNTGQLIIIAMLWKG